MARSDVQLMLDVKAAMNSLRASTPTLQKSLVNFLYRMVRNREQAEDLAQEVCNFALGQQICLADAK